MAHSQRRSVGDRAQFLFWFPYIYLLDRHSTRMCYSRTIHKSQIEVIEMRSTHKRMTFQDNFGRKYYCKHARLGLRRSERKQQRELLRLIEVGASKMRYSSI